MSSTTIDVDKLVIDINQKLPAEQQIQRDDPMYSAVVLNTTVIDTYVQHIQQKLDETLQQLTIVSEQHVDRAAAVAENMTLTGGGNIEKQLDMAALRWEERLKKTAEDADSKLQRASRLAWIGAILITIAACVFGGTWLGNTIIDLTHQQKSAHKQQDRTDLLPVDR